MDDLIGEIEHALRSRLWLIALQSTFTLPDICAALESPDGRTTGRRYQAWFDKWVSPAYMGRAGCLLTGETAWGFRCGLLHQGRMKPHVGAYSRLLIVEPDDRGNVFHRNILNDALNLDIRIFCNDVIASVRNWLPTVRGREPFESNLRESVRRHPNGIAPYIVGTSVIG